MVILSKTEKNSNHSKHLSDHTFMTSTWKGDVHMRRGLKIYHMSSDFFFFKLKVSNVHLANGGGGGVTKLGGHIFVAIINVNEP